MIGRLDNRHEIELAEGISVHLRPATLIPRIQARIIDYLILLLIWFILLILLGVSGIIFGGEVVQGLLLLAGFILFWFYDVFWELSRLAGTPGKKAMKLKVVKMSGAPTDFSTSFLRALLLPIDLFPLGLSGIITSLASKHSQRLGDLAAGTLVVHKIEELHGELQNIPLSPVRPQVPLNREEQIAFLEYGQRYERLSKERQNEIVDCLLPHKGTSPTGMDYALGIAGWLKERES